MLALAARGRTLLGGAGARLFATGAEKPANVFAPRLVSHGWRKNKGGTARPMLRFKKATKRCAGAAVGRLSAPVTAWVCAALGS